MGILSKLMPGGGRGAGKELELKPGAGIQMINGKQMVATPRGYVEYTPQGMPWETVGNAAPGTPNKSVTTGPTQQGGFDLGGLLGGIAGGIGNAFQDPALLSMAVGTGLGLASGQLSPIQSMGAGAMGAQGILNQQREDELALRNKQWQMELAMAQGGQPSGLSISDTIALAKAGGLDQIKDPIERQKALNAVRQGKAFDVNRNLRSYIPLVGGLLGGKQTVQVGQ